MASSDSFSLGLMIFCSLLLVMQIAQVAYVQLKGYRLSTSMMSSSVFSVLLEDSLLLALVNQAAL